ncbi:uncharacterized protein B0J16DRAFT_83363 [Fusarium flagelliforme]|nr:uncharacterized protein B0J16DRAFT_83363 [Fusarium flagelliforme]KAH7193639.1 hypothetical protein B0J16DRAFT_83363 [Fusarium flagelliforme]
MTEATCERTSCGERFTADGETGHWRKDCPKRRCKWCDKRGHLANQCPEDRCVQCSQIGHTSEDCNNSRARCENCGAPHLTRLCRKGKENQGSGQGNKRDDSLIIPNFANVRQQVIRNRSRSSLLEEFNAMDAAQHGTGDDVRGTTDDSLFIPNFANRPSRF